LETILSSTEHEFIDDDPQIFATNNFKAHKEKINGENTHKLFDKFSMSSVSALKGLFAKRDFNLLSHCAEM